MRGAGGTEGGVGKFSIGLVLSGLAAWLFFDSVRVTTAGYGFFTGWFRNGYDTTSMGIIFIPFFVAVVALFYNAQWKWAWWLLYIGIGILAIEILSRIRFLMHMKTTHLMLMLVMFAGGVGLMLKGLREDKK